MTAVSEAARERVMRSVRQLLWYAFWIGVASHMELMRVFTLLRTGTLDSTAEWIWFVVWLLALPLVAWKVWQELKDLRVLLTTWYRPQGGSRAP